MLLIKTHGKLMYLFAQVRWHMVGYMTLDGVLNEYYLKLMVMSTFAPLLKFDASFALKNFT